MFPFDGEVNIFNGDTSARHGNERTYSDGGSSYETEAAVASVLGDIASLASQTAARVIAPLSIAQGLYAFMNSFDPGTEVAEWAPNARSDVVHHTLFTWTHNKNTNAECRVTDSASMAALQRTLSGQNNDVLPATVGKQTVKANEIDDRILETLDVSEDDTVEIISDYPLTLK